MMKMKYDVTIEGVTEALKKEYEEAKKAKHIAKPLAYALHEV